MDTTVERQVSTTVPALDRVTQVITRQVGSNSQSQNLTVTEKVSRAFTRVPVQTVISGGQMGPRGYPGVNGGGTIAPIHFAYGDAPGVVWTAPANGLLSYSRLSIDVAFDGTGATIKSGTLADSEAVLPISYNNPYQVGDYENTPDVVLTTGQSIYLTIHPGSAVTQGSGFLLIQFILDS